MATASIEIPCVLQICWPLSSTNACFQLKVNIFFWQPRFSGSLPQSSPEHLSLPTTQASVSSFAKCREDVCCLWREPSEVSGCTQRFNRNSILFLNLFFFIQQVLISLPFYTHQCIHVNPNHPIHHTTTPPPLSSPWRPYVCSLHLCLNLCPANRFICTIFLGSNYMR